MRPRCIRKRTRSTLRRLPGGGRAKDLLPLAIRAFESAGKAYKRILEIDPCYFVPNRTLPDPNAQQKRQFEEAMDRIYGPGGQPIYEEPKPEPLPSPPIQVQLKMQCGLLRLWLNAAARATAQLQAKVRLARPTLLPIAQLFSVMGKFYRQIHPDLLDPVRAARARMSRTRNSQHAC